MKSKALQLKDKIAKKTDRQMDMLKISTQEVILIINIDIIESKFLAKIIIPFTKLQKRFLRFFVT